MSAKIMGHVWELDLSANKLLVLLAMADHADQDGHNVYPSMDLIAWKTGYSEKQVRRIVKLLVADGLLTCEKQSKGRKPSTYSVHLEAGKMKPPRETQPSQNDQIKPSQNGGVKKSEDAQPGHFDPVNLDIQMSTKPSLEPKDKEQKNSDTKSVSRPRKSKPYDDVPGETRKAILTAWLNSLPEKPTTNEYVKDTNQNLAAGIVRAGYGAADVERYVKAQYQDKFWQGKFLPLQNIATNLGIWLKGHPITGVIHPTPSSGAPPPTPAALPETALDRARRSQRELYEAQKARALAKASGE